MDNLKFKFFSIFLISTRFISLILLFDKINALKIGIKSIFFFNLNISFDAILVIYIINTIIPPIMIINIM